MMNWKAHQNAKWKFFSQPLNNFFLFSQEFLTETKEIKNSKSVKQIIKKIMEEEARKCWF